MTLPTVGMAASLQGAAQFAADAKRVEDAYKRIAAAELEIAKTSPQAAAAISAMDKTFMTTEGVEDWAATMEQLAQEIIPETTSAWENMAQIMGLGALQQVAGEMGRLGDSLLSVAKDATLTAARAEELYVVLDNLSEQSGVSSAAMREQVAAIKDLGITTDVAANLVSQFVRSDLDLSKAAELARLAQDAAVISMEDSSQALAGMLHGVLTLQPELLRYRGIIVDFQSEYKKWADANNRTVLSLTSAEKQTIALNAVLAQGENIAGTYEAAMGTASKQMRSFSRYTEELKEDFGNALLPALTAGVGGAKDLAKAMMALPEPVKAVIATTGALTGGVLKGTSSLIGFGAQAAQLGVALKTLGATASIAQAGLIGMGIALAGIAAVGIITAIKEHEKAQKEMASQIVITATSYGDYVYLLEEAKLGNYKLSEELYNTVKAHQEAEGAAYAQAEAEQYLAGMSPTEKIEADLKEMAGEVANTADQLVTLAEAGFEWAAAAISGEDAIVAFNDTILESIGALSTADQAARGLMAGIGGIIPVMQQTESATVGVTNSMLALAAVNAEIDMSEGFKRSAEEAQAYYGSIAYLEAQMSSAVGKAAQQMVTAEERADSARESARSQLMNALGGLEKDHAKAVTSILEQIAQVDIELQADILEAEKANAQERLDAQRELASSLDDLERDLAASREEIARDLERQLSDMRREYAQARADLARDLARDLEDIERAHLSKMRELEASYYAYLSDLADDYGDKLSSITEKYAKERESIEKKYELDPEPTYDEQRESLQQQLDELLAMEEEYRKGGLGYEYKQRKEDILAALEELKEAELAELEARKSEELTELEEWYAKEQEAANEAYRIAQEELKSAYEEQRAERLRENERRLEDMKIAYEQEIAQAKEAAARKQADLEIENAARRAELLRHYEETMADLDRKLAEEKEKLTLQAEENKERLAEQLADEQASYAERRNELSAHYSEQIRETEAKFAEEKQKILDGLEAEKLELITGLGKQSEAFAEAYAEQRDQLENHLFGPGGMLEKWRAYQEQLAGMYGVDSPSRWFIEFGQDQVRGLEIGTKDFSSALGGLEQQFSGFQSDVTGMLGGATVPGPSLPAVASRSQQNVDNSRSVNLNYTGKPYSEPSIRAIVTMMEMANG